MEQGLGSNRAERGRQKGRTRTMGGNPLLGQRELEEALAELEGWKVE
ncbi:hypothetical protein [Cohnella hongkongensis]|uniref:Uncharacterized protein n=1 Tax=Cohnella hongkongensis TaxID=178337 RepID=A0ABV9FJE5_9BACL